MSYLRHSPLKSVGSTISHDSRFSSLRHFITSYFQFIGMRPIRYKIIISSDNQEIRIIFISKSLLLIPIIFLEINSRYSYWI